jgi:hypothetical protein
MALISQMDPKEAGELLYKKFMAAHEANDANGRPEDHPSRDVQKWNRIAATGGMNSEKRIEKGEDDEQPEKTAGGNNGNGSGPAPAQDSFSIGTDSVPRYEYADGRVVFGSDALEAHSRQSNPTRASNMASRIKGYTRLK